MSEPVCVDWQGCVDRSDVIQVEEEVREMSGRWLLSKLRKAHVEPLHHPASTCVGFVLVNWFMQVSYVAGLCVLDRAGVAAEHCNIKTNVAKP